MIVITGMHRSGTSLTANLLHELDVSFGAPHLLMPADRWNPRGYYESVEFFIMNDRLIIGDAPMIRRFRLQTEEQRSLPLRVVMTVLRARYLLIGGARGIERRAARHADDMRALARKYDGAAVKDPRFSLTIGAWARRVPVDRVLYCYRHPIEAARSLKRRNGTPIPLGLRLWRTHVDTFLDQVRGLPVVMVNYNRYFSAEAIDEVSRLFVFAGRASDPVAARTLLDRVLTPDLHRNVDDGTPLDRATAARYERLHALHAVHATPIPLV